VICRRFSVKVIVPGALASLLLLSAGRASAGIACCSSWLSQAGETLATCILQPQDAGGPCPLSLPIGITVIEDPSVEVSAAWAPCRVSAERSCCLEDCTGDMARCNNAPAPNPSCCAGFCANPGGAAAFNTSGCTAAGYTGACTADAIQVPPFDAGSYAAPVSGLPTDSPEWTVSFGLYMPLPDAGSTADDDAGIAFDFPLPPANDGRCSAAPGPAPAWGWPLWAVGVLLLGRRKK